MEANEAEIVEVESAEIESLYPTTRLLSAEAAAAEELLDSAQQEAAEIREQADTFLEKAQADAQEIRDNLEEFRRQVRETAIEDGRKAVASELDELLGAASREVERLPDLMREHLTRWAFKMAEAVIEIEFALEPARIAEVVSKALEDVSSVDNYRNIAICLHPDDASFVAGRIDELRRKAALSENLKVVERPQQPRQSVRIETEMGVYDAGLSTRLDRLREELLGDGK